VNWGIKGPLTPPARSTANRSRVGVVTRLRYASAADRASYMAAIRARGIQHIRDDWRWEEVEQTRGVFDWSSVDAVMVLAAQHGITVLPTLCYSAKWAASGPTKFHPPTDPATFATYCTRLVQRYGRGGQFWSQHPELTPVPVTVAEVWNEPWLYQYWAPTPDVAAYARLVRAAATAIHAVDPAFEVLMSGDVTLVPASGADTRWIRALLAADPTIDTVVNGYSMHPYPNVRSHSPYDETTAKYEYSRVQLAHDDVLFMGKRNLPWWITEIGWSNGNTGTSAPFYARGVSESTSATYTEGALVRAVQEWPYVKRVYVQTYEKSTGIATDFWGNAGLLRSDGSPKPALEKITGYLSG
jgi:hypothetical protein